MVASTFSQITVGGSGVGVLIGATQLVIAGQGGVLVYNTSTVNTVWLTENSAFTSGDAGTAGVTPLAPLSSVVFDGTDDVFAVCQPGQNAVVNLYPSALSFVPQVQLTQLFNLSAPFTFDPSLGGIGFNTPIFDITQFNSYDILIYARNTNQGVAGSPLVFEVELLWYDDPAGSNNVYEESWVLWLPNIPNGSGKTFVPKGSGPMHGKYFELRVATPVNSIAGSVTIDTLSIYGSERTLEKSDWRQPDPQSMQSGIGLIPGGAGADIYNNILANIPATTLAQNNTFWAPLGLMSGTFQCLITNTNAIASGILAWAPGGTANLGGSNSQLGLVNGSLQNGIGSPGGFFAIPIGANGITYQTNLVAPRAPCYLVISTSSTANSSIRFRAWGIQQ